MEIIQKEIVLGEKRRGFHLITGEILNQLDEIKNIKTGTAHFFIMHTSASLCINEKADPDVRSDMEKYFNRLVPENEPWFDHNSEGTDDMPAHLKSVILGTSITIPVTSGKLNMGTWQGIYLCEHRNRGGRRHITVTITGK